MDFFRLLFTFFGTVFTTSEFAMKNTVHTANFICISKGTKKKEKEKKEDFVTNTQE